MIRPIGTQALLIALAASRLALGGLEDPPAPGAAVENAQERPASGPGIPFGKTKPDDVALAELRRFLASFDPRVDGLPKRIGRGIVEQALRAELAKGMPPPGRAARMVELADFTDAIGIVPDLIRMLDRREATEAQFLASLAFTRAIGLLGDPRQREWGRSFYHYLLSLPFVEERAPQVLDCYADLAPEEPIEATRRRIDAILEELRAREPDDPSAGLALREIKDHRNGAFPRIEAATALKAEILALPDPAARLDRLVAIYLGWDMRYRQYMNRWATRTILREARAGRAGAAAAAFRRALPGLDPADEAASGRRALALHAIEFLGGVVSPEERGQMRPDARKFDLLSLD